MERKLLCQPFTATNCSTLARHALKLICQTTFHSILFKSLLSHVGQLSCCDVTEVTWPKRRIFSCRWRRCLKHRVCFHSILLRTSGKCQSIKQTACMLNFIDIVQSKWYLWLKISVQGPLNAATPKYAKTHAILRKEPWCTTPAAAVNKRGKTAHLLWIWPRFLAFFDTYWYWYSDNWLSASSGRGREHMWPSCGQKLMQMWQVISGSHLLTRAAIYEQLRQVRCKS